MNLNEKIAKWCGFEYQDSFVLPNFTESMDAIVKWVVPKVTDYAIERHGNKYHKVSVQFTEDDDIYYQMADKSMPMAFCKALEKYIDSQEVK